MSKETCQFMSSSVAPAQNDYGSMQGVPATQTSTTIPSSWLPKYWNMLAIGASVGQSYLVGGWRLINENLLFIFELVCCVNLTASSCRSARISNLALFHQLSSLKTRCANCNGGLHSHASLMLPKPFPHGRCGTLDVKTSFVRWALQFHG